MPLKEIKDYTLGRSGDKSLILLGNDGYIFCNIGKYKIYYPEKYSASLKNDIEVYADGETNTIITTIQNKYINGIFALKDGSDWYVFGPFIDTSLAYCVTDNEILLSDSTFTIAYRKHFKVSKAVISAYLVAGLPFEPFQNMSFWEEISKIRPFHILKICSGIITESKLTYNFNKENDIGQITKLLRDTIISKIFTQNDSFESVSCDVSGGVDSASIAYILNKITSNPMIFHAESDESANSDTKWAQYIADELRLKLNKLPSIDKNSTRFSVDRHYIGNNIPDAPLLWGDTEGYVEEMLHMLTDKQNHLHMIGIGGDELFASIPAVPWSIIREEGIINSIPFILKYCILKRRPFFCCLRDLADNTSLKDEVRHTIENGFSESKRNSFRELSWSGSLVLPQWLSISAKSDAKVRISSIYSEKFQELSENRSEYQRLQSLIFQKEVFSQIKQIAGDDIEWYAPFLDAEVIKTALKIPSKYCLDPDKTKPMLYESLKGIVPLEVFTRGVKGDYSSAFYNDYRAAASKWIGRTKDFLLSKIGIIDSECLDRELSMPSSKTDRVDNFMRLCNVERWLRQVNKYIEIGV